MALPTPVAVVQPAASAPLGGNRTITRPPEVVKDDLMVVQYVVFQSITNPIVPPAGWSTAYQDSATGATGTSDTRMATFYKVATASEPASYDFTSDYGYVNAGMVVYRGYGVVATGGVKANHVTGSPYNHHGGLSVAVPSTVANAVALTFDACPFQSDTTFTTSGTSLYSGTPQIRAYAYESGTLGAGSYALPALDHSDTNHVKLGAALVLKPAATVLLQDDFNRADSTTVVGDPAVGGPWAASTGVWGISTGQLYLSNAATPAHYLLAPGAADVDFQWTQVTAITGSSSPIGGGVIRAADNANAIYMARVNTGTFAFFQSTAGTGVQITQEWTSVANQVLRLVAYKEQIWLYINGTLAGTFLDPKYEPATRTKVGFRNGGSSTSRWDDVTARAVDAQPFAISSEGDDIDLGLTLADTSLLWTPSLYKGRDSALQDESEIP